MNEEIKKQAVQAAAQEHAEWCAHDSGGFLWTSVDNIVFSEGDDVARARWRAKVVFKTIDDSGIEGTEISPNVFYEEESVELRRMNNDDDKISYFVSEWGVESESSFGEEIDWDDSRISQEEIDSYCQWIDEESLRDQLLDRFGSIEAIKFDSFPQRFRPWLMRVCDDNSEL